MLDFGLINFQSQALEKLGNENLPFQDGLVLQIVDNFLLCKINLFLSI